MKKVENHSESPRFTPGVNRPAVQLTKKDRGRKRNSKLAQKEMRQQLKGE